jgi:hypothetical protein
MLIGLLSSRNCQKTFMEIYDEGEETTKCQKCPENCEICYRNIDLLP